MSERVLLNHTDKYDMIEDEYHRKECDVIPRHISQKRERQAREDASPCWEFRSPTMFSFYFYFEESEENPQKNDIQSEHIFIMKKSQKLQLLLFK